MFRSFDLLFSLTGFFLFLPLLPLFIFLVFCTDGGIIFRQKRLGRHKKIFTILKLRTMRYDTPSVATHLANPGSVTSIGSFLRRTKLDELPQLWNVLKGDMSLVGPRPGLPTQTELIDVRSKLGVYSVRPGITGLAQINGIDMSSPELLAKIDAKMINQMSLTNYFRLIFLTVVGYGRGDQIDVK